MTMKWIREPVRYIDGECETVLYLVDISESEKLVIRCGSDSDTKAITDDVADSIIDKLNVVTEQ